MPVKLYPLGDRGVTLSCGGEGISLAVQRRIWWIAQTLQQQREEGLPILEVIPGMNNLTLTFVPQQSRQRSLLKRLESLWHESAQRTADTAPLGRTVEVPVTYGGPLGMDLPEVAKYHQMGIDEVVERHTAPLYTVYFVGFMPGFLYLGGLDDALITPRHSTPRLAIPAGSVGIGGAQTGVYPKESPGGWQIIGNSKLTFFDATKEEPSLLMPGDQLRFVVEEILE